MSGSSYIAADSSLGKSHIRPTSDQWRDLSSRTFFARGSRWKEPSL